MRGGIAESATWHLGGGSLVWILNNGNAATLLDGKQPHRAVLEGPAQNDSNHALAVNACRSPEQRIDGGPVTVLPGTAQHTHFAGFNGEVIIRTGDIDVAAADGFLVGDLAYRHAAVAAQVLFKKAGEIRHHVSHDQNASGKTGRQAGNDDPEGVERPRRTADHDDVALRQE